ncbi:MAG TPA: permease [Planctomycetota bacterium]|nr:permease [Planctomycetota bacterium]
MSLWGVLVPLLLLSILVWLAYVKKGGAAVGEGFSKSGALFVSVAPPMAIGFLLAGFVALLVPQEAVARALGENTGSRGLFLASLAGILTPGGPFTHFPLLAALRSQGAGIGPLSAYITAWALLGAHRILLWEIPLLGWRFVLVRVGVSLFCAPLVGWMAQAVGLAVGRLSVACSSP